MIKIDFKNFPINMGDELVTAYPAVIYIFNDFRFDGPILGYGMIQRRFSGYALSGKINPRIKDLIDSDVLELVPKITESCGIRSIDSVSVIVKRR
ncbi:MAG: hypothetical protein IMF01_09610 [Proteobacteria bacterium]|nr:hypothetical protein [Pseudomonadota bacterium]